MTGTRHNQDRDRVRDATDIVRLVGEHVALKARGREFVGLCPFHDDHKPSMYIVPAKGIFHCFVCGAGGDAFGFVKRFHRMDFREALEFLARRANIPLSSETPAEGAARSSRTAIVKANAQASEFFAQVLRHASHGEVARQTIEKRAISPDMVERFGLGAAPDRWDGLLLWIRQRGLDESVFADAGLLKKHPERGSLYDTFRNRLVFPIHDLGGRIVAFGGRRLRDEDEPKYVNSPETELFSKGATLYALSQAATAIQRERVAIVTEGYTDTIACHQAGFTNVVATLGTALTRQHASSLRRLCDGVVLLFDGDEAGRKAADRAVEIFFGESLDVRIATLAAHTDAKDPDELLKREGGAGVLRLAIDSARDLLDYRFDRLREEVRGLGSAAFSRAIEAEADGLIQLGFEKASPALRARIVQRLGELIAGEEGGNEAAIATIRARLGRRGRPEPEAGEGARRLSTQEHALGCILCEPALFEGLAHHDRDLIAPERYSSTPMRAIAQAVADCADEGERPDLRAVLDRLTEDEPRRLAAGLCARIDADSNSSADHVGKFLSDCLKGLARQRKPEALGTTEQLLAERARHQRYGGNAASFLKKR